MRWSPSRLTNAVLPSAVNATWLGPALSLPSATLPSTSTALPVTRTTDTVPSSRFATSASVPSRLIDTPAAPAPTCAVWISLGGEACRSTTLSRLSDSVVSLKTRLPAVTSAIDSSVEIATAKGGPTTLVGTSISATSRGCAPRMSISASVSGCRLAGTLATPLSSTDLLSLADTASQPRVALSDGGGVAQPAVKAQAAASIRIMVFMGSFFSAPRPPGRRRSASPGPCRDAWRRTSRRRRAAAVSSDAVHRRARVHSRCSR